MYRAREHLLLNALLWVKNTSDLRGSTCAVRLVVFRTVVVRSGVVVCGVQSVVARVIGYRRAGS